MAHGHELCVQAGIISWYRARVLALRSACSNSISALWRLKSTCGARYLMAGNPRASETPKLFFVRTRPPIPWESWLIFVVWPMWPMLKARWLAVDNCLLHSPRLRSSLELGADINHSLATKYIDGQGRCLVWCRGGRPRHMRSVGFFADRCPTLSHSNAWVMLKGSGKPCRLRLQAHVPVRRSWPSGLNKQPEVEHVLLRRPSEPPQHELSQAAAGSLWCRTQL